MSLTMSCDFDDTQKLYRKITFLLKLPESFPEKFTEAIKRSVNLCAVKKHIVNTPEFEIITV